MQNNDFVSGYACAIANMIRLEGCYTTEIMEAYIAGLGYYTLKNLTENNIDQSDIEIMLDEIVRKHKL